MAKYGHVGEVATTFEKLGQMQGGHSVMDYLATHPHPQDRVDRLYKMARDQNLPMGEPVDLDEAFEDFLVRTGEIPESAREEGRKFSLTTTKD